MGLCALDVANCMPDLHDPTTSSSHRPAPTAPEHLNNTGCKIKYSEGKGRGVYGTSGLLPSSHPARLSIIYLSIASKPMPAYTLLEISPALLFSAEEYEAHGRHTALDHYTFKWRDGRMALALGLGAHCADHPIHPHAPLRLSNFDPYRLPVQPFRLSKRLLFHRHRHRVYPIHDRARHRARRRALHLLRLKPLV